MIIEALQHIQQKIQDLSAEKSRTQIIAVTKTRSIEEILPLLEAGHEDFGENKIQEALAKWPKLKEKFPNIKLHFIGALQKNKVRQAVEFFDVIASIDSKELADKIAAEMKKQQKYPDLFIQVNIGGEPQKSGVLVENFEGLYKYCRNELGLCIEGLQCIPPKNKDSKPYFDSLQKLSKAYLVPKLSMGMSQDYEVAVKCGTDYIRIGTALFGGREG